jgi:hypothetical protein
VEPEGTLEMMGTMTMMMETALRATPMKLRKRKNSERRSSRGASSNTTA